MEGEIRLLNTINKEPYIFSCIKEECGGEDIKIPEKERNILRDLLSGKNVTVNAVRRSGMTTLSQWWIVTEMLFPSEAKDMDILVVTVNHKNVQTYLRSIEVKLLKLFNAHICSCFSIKSHNDCITVSHDGFNIRLVVRCAKCIMPRVYRFYKVVFDNAGFYCKNYLSIWYTTFILDNDCQYFAYSVFNKKEYEDGKLDDFVNLCFKHRYMADENSMYYALNFNDIVCGKLNRADVIKYYTEDTMYEVLGNDFIEYYTPKNILKGQMKKGLDEFKKLFTMYDNFVKNNISIE